MFVGVMQDVPHGIVANHELQKSTSLLGQFKVGIYENVRIPTDRSMKALISFSVAILRWEIGWMIRRV